MTCKIMHRSRALWCTTHETDVMAFGCSVAAENLQVETAQLRAALLERNNTIEALEFQNEELRARLRDIEGP